jgi:hypothetical protein
MRIAILFGAGASFGSGNVSPYPPPLGSDRYADLAENFPQSWGSLPSEIVEVFKKNQFEEAMVVICTTHSALIQRLLIDMTIYFSRFRAGATRSDCYSQLLDVLTTTRLCRSTGIATLNYECVFDEIMARAGRPLTYVAPEPTACQSVLWKLHGACNLLPSSAIDIRHSTIVSLSNRFYEGPVEVCCLDQIGQKYARGYSMPAAMSLFAKGKHTPVASSFVGTARDQWAQWVKRSEVSIIIGAHPNHGDEHVWNPIIEGRSKVWYVGGTEGGDYPEIADQLRSRLTVLGRTFLDALPSLLRRLRISA